MTDRQERIRATRLALKMFRNRFGRIQWHDIQLLESGYDGVRIDYVLFRNRFTKREYRVCFDYTAKSYFIDEMDHTVLPNWRRV